MKRTFCRWCCKFGGVSKDGICSPCLEKRRQAWKPELLKSGFRWHGKIRLMPRQTGVITLHKGKQ